MSNITKYSNFTTASKEGRAYAWVRTNLLTKMNMTVRLTDATLQDELARAFEAGRASK